MVKTDDTKKAATVLESSLHITNYKVIDSEEIRIYDENAKPDAISRALVQSDVCLLGLYESGVSLEDYFKQLVGEESK